MFIFRQPGANIVETVDRVLAVLPQLKARIPASINVRVLSDRTTTIRASVRDVQRTMAISMGLVIMVVFVFLRSVRTTLIPAVAVPVSLVGTFGVLYLFGYSVDNLSLMALTIATGFVVDDAIVVIENITRHIEQGMTPMQAALRGAAEIGFTVMSISISLIAVFIPILLMGGIVGRLFREFAITLSVAIIPVAVDLADHDADDVRAAVPAATNEEQHGFFYRLSESGFVGVAARGYEKSLGWVLRHQPLMLVVTLATVALDRVSLYRSCPRDFSRSRTSAAWAGRSWPIRRLVPGDAGARGAACTDRGHAGSGRRQSSTLFGRAAAEAAQRSTARMQCHSSSRWRSAKISADEVIARLRPKLARSRRRKPVSAGHQDLRIGGRVERRAVSIHAAKRQRERAEPVGAAGLRASCGRCRSSPT